MASFLYPFLLLAAPAPATLNEPTYERLSADRYRLQVTLTGSTALADAQQAVRPLAEELCAGAPPHFGKHRFEAKEAVSGAGPQVPTIHLIQEISCSRAAVPITAVPPAPATPPTMQDGADVRARTLAYLAAKDSGDFAKARAMHTAAAREFMTDANWRQPRGAFNQSVRGDPRRLPPRITWYDNPQGAPPARYVAADYRAEFADGALYCGYVMWQLQADGNYLAIREEEGRLTGADAARIDPANRGTLLTQLGCKN